jgi:hypothetical protein
LLLLLLMAPLNLCQERPGWEERVGCDGWGVGCRRSELGRERKLFAGMFCWSRARRASQPATSEQGCVERDLVVPLENFKGSLVAPNLALGPCSARPER